MRGQRGPAKLPFRPQPANQAWLQPYMTPLPIPSKLMSTQQSDKAPVFPPSKAWAVGSEEHNCGEKTQARDKVRPRLGIEEGAKSDKEQTSCQPCLSFCQARLCPLSMKSPQARCFHSAHSSIARDFVGREVLS